MAGLVLRTGRPGDLAAVRQVFRRASLSNPDDRALLTARPELLDLADDALREGRVRVAEVDGRVVGFATTSVHDTHVELDDLFVDPDRHRSGVGRALVDDAVATTRRAGRSALEVDANPAASAFYGAVGFVTVGEVPTHGPPAARMRLVVDGPGRLPAPVWWIVGATALVLLSVAERHGWHRDELYFLQAGRHLAWGYVDQPPFTPLVARLADEVARHDLLALRLVPALATAATVVLGALLTRELGADRRGTIVAAGVVAVGSYALGAGHLLSTSTFDLTAWMALLWIAARLLRRADPRWWLAFGAVAGAALWNKHLPALLAASLVVGLVLDRRWTLLVSPWLMAGGALALVLAAPNLAWQAANGWPQLEMAEALSERLAGENRLLLLPMQLVLLGVPLTPLLWWGARWLARDPGGIVFRPLLWAWPAALALTFASGGRPYYVLPLTLAVALAGVVAHERRRPDLGAVPALVVATGLLSALLALPVLPASTVRVTGAVNDTLAETIGWRELAEQVAAVVEALPPEERDRVVLLAASYGEAGALDRYGPALGLPPAHSGHNSYADFRQPTDDDATVVAVRYGVATLSPWFERCGQVATVENRHRVDNEVRGAPIVVCRGLRASWDEVWPRLRHLS